MMQGFTFLGKCPEISRSDLFKDQFGKIFRKTRGRRDLAMVKDTGNPGNAPVAYSTRKRMGAAARKHVESNDLTTNQVKELERAAKRCGFDGLKDVTMDYELREILGKLKK